MIICRPIHSALKNLLDNLSELFAECFLNKNIEFNVWNILYTRPKNKQKRLI